jgi:hypothetical protein
VLQITSLQKPVKGVARIISWQDVPHYNQKEKIPNYRRGSMKSKEPA